MPRRGFVKKIELDPDPKYNDPLVAQLINRVIMCGKKGNAYRIVYSSLEVIAKKTGQDPLLIFRRALSNSKPLLEVRSRRVGGATYQVPMEVPERRSYSLAFRWLVNNSRKRHEKTMEGRLAAEIMDAANGTGITVKKREDMHKMAEANKAFAHYRW
ncbi:MAG: 30S ribosomal protein S7 [Omnitrophica WOR_2 bacterium RBG_13_44_8]|jgi:small subunit ribosomal protein S7|nr:MAG: 30S ribosomal protein S7 [Omnitrophica WOR_2 bacterium RBG_13_44_8]